MVNTNILQPIEKTESSDYYISVCTQTHTHTNTHTHTHTHVQYFYLIVNNINFHLLYFIISVMNNEQDN